jgi:ABC-type glycerol-3-phosphate transport system substrate-binding protein
MTRRAALFLGLLVMAVLAVGIVILADRLDANSDLEGRMLVWHAGDMIQAEALDQVIDAFSTLHPGVEVRAQRFANLDEMRLQFQLASNAGLGPDLLVAPVEWLPDLTAPELTNAPTIDAIGDRVSDEVLARFLPTALASLERDGALYGLPLSVDVPALYFNRRRVDTPPATLDELLVAADAGQTVLLPINFEDAFWGVQAFGGRLVGEDGRVILDQGGFANWLAWLSEARNTPGMILDTNRIALRNRFLDGDADFYIGYATEYAAITEALGQDSVGVAPLPSGPIGNAAPFLDVNALFFSSASSPNQRRLALELAQFMTSAAQSGAFMRSAAALPANAQAQINPRLNPVAATFAAQARAAVPLPDLSHLTVLTGLGTEAYVRVLSGGEPPAEVAYSTANAMNDVLGYAPSSAPAATCSGVGTVRLAHNWDEQAARGLDGLVERFHEVCPLAIIDVVGVTAEGPDSDLLTGEYVGLRPTVAVASRRDILAQQADEPFLKNLLPIVNSDALQRFWPGSVDSMRMQSSLVGLPAAMDVDGLYYNPQLVDTPARTLDELRQQAAQGVPIVLPGGFEAGLWGIGAFGGRLLDEAGHAVLDQGGFAAWLAWLKDSRDKFGIQLERDRDQYREQFLRGETAYYIGPASDLATLLDALGPDALDVALLPAGPEGSARPLIHVEGFFFRDSAPELQTAIGLDFARFATQPDSQAYLAETAGYLPVNTTVDLVHLPMLNVFVQQARTAIVIRTLPALNDLVALGEQAYTAVFEDGVDPAAAAADLNRQINEANGIAPTPVATEEPVETITTTPALSITVPITPQAVVTVTPTVSAPLAEPQTPAPADRP